MGKYRPNIGLMVVYGAELCLDTVPDTAQLRYP